jgi:hypothetical protein
MLRGATSYRVSLEGIRDAIVEAKALLAARGATLLVLNNDFYETDAAEGLRRGAEEAAVSYLDMDGAFAELARARTRALEATQGLSPPAVREGTILVRVQAPGADAVYVEYTRIPEPAAKMEMLDDGQEGDQVAGDSIWTLRVPTTPDRKLLYAFWERRAGRLTREFGSVSATGAWRLYSGWPAIDTFGVDYLHSDPSHPDEEGHGIIAERLLAAILARAGVTGAVAAR